MYPKFSKSDVYRTEQPVVSLGNSFEGQFIIKACEKIGEYDGSSYVNCFDIYEFDGIRFLYGVGAPVGENNFNYNLMTECGRNIHNTCSSYTREDVKKRKKLVKKFCESIHKGICSPTVINSWISFKNNLIRQKDYFPKKDILDIAKELLITYTKPEAKEKIDSKLLENTEYIKKHYPQLFKKVKNPGDELRAVLTKIYNNKKEIYKQAEKKRLQEYNGYEHF